MIHLQVVQSSRRNKKPPFYRVTVYFGAGSRKACDAQHKHRLYEVLHQMERQGFSYTASSHMALHAGEPGMLTGTTYAICYRKSEDI